jgi:DNA-binding SARP family transcriptional activator
VARHTGPVLPEEAYEDWAIGARQRIGAAVASARRRLAGQAVAEERWDEVVEHAHALLDIDGFDERAHEMLVRALVADGRRGEAQVALDRYRAAMTELGVTPGDLLDA